VILWYDWARTGQALNPGYASWNWQTSFSPGVFLRMLAAYTVSPGRGMVVLCPVVVLAALGWRSAWRERPAMAGAVGLIFLAYLLFHAARVAPDPWAWGPRYLVPTVGPLLLLWPWGLRGRRASAAALLGLGVAVQLVSIVVPYGTWLHKVEAQTHTSDAVVFRLRYWPLAGQVDTLRSVETTRLNLAGSGAEGGAVSEEFKQHMRESLDFWWFYAWRLGVPAGRLALPLAALLALVGLSGRRLARELREAGP
jgi:hypothetical protein